MHTAAVTSRVCCIQHATRETATRRTQLASEAGSPPSLLCPGLPQGFEMLSHQPALTLSPQFLVHLPPLLFLQQVQTRVNSPYPTATGNHSQDYRSLFSLKRNYKPNQCIPHPRNM